MVPIKEQNSSYFVLWPFKFVLTSVKLQLSGHFNKDSRNGNFTRSRKHTWMFCFFVHLASLVIADSGDLP